LHRQGDGQAFLGAGETDLLILSEQPGARRVKGVTGLYHFAVLVPNRPALAQALRRIAETGVPVEGFADHGVSEAIYLPDPDGNGIEIYRDRPRPEWPVENGQLKMMTDPLDVEGLMAAAPAEPWPGLPAGTVIGHVHLHVARIASAESFYAEIVGFDLMQRYGPSASFLAAGGYHHHVGINTWAGLNAPPPPADAAGLRWFSLALPNETALNETADRVRQAGLPLTEQPEGLLTRDPAGNGVMLAVVARP
jgi:catechol 2,3-dioxygenase